MKKYKKVILFSLVGFILSFFYIKITKNPLKSKRYNQIEFKTENKPVAIPAGLDKPKENLNNNDLSIVDINNDDPVGDYYRSLSTTEKVSCIISFIILICLLLSVWYIIRCR